ncbi:MAG: SulP family inorganic anion transporter [Gallionella sp.]|nr:SulP family inorganic anion transporter [Gallionella sp.]
MTLSEIKQRYLSRPGFSGDMWGGLAAMLVALPSAIAFGVTIFAPLGSSLAAQGALAGILGATVLGLIVPLAGGSTRLITAPCAPAAAVLAALAVTFTQQGSSPVGTLMLLGMIGILAGVIQIVLGLAGIGRLIKFIPFPVVSGYLSGVGLIIIGSQIPKFLGMPEASLIETLRSPGGWQWQPALVGGVVVATMLLIPRITRVVPAAILALLAGAACYLGLAWFDPALMEIVDNPLLVGPLGQESGAFTDGLRQYWQSFSGIDFSSVAKVMLPALTLAALLSIDTLKTCLVVDTMTSSHHNSNRELMGQGLGNMASSLIGGIPGAGTMGASLINISSGGTTKLSGFMAGLFSLGALLLLSPLIAWVPVAALAAILIVIGFRMIDTHGLAFFFNPATRLDFIVILSVIMVAIFGNLIAASGVGVALAILLFIREQTRSTVVRNRFEGGEFFHKHALKLRDMERVARNAGQSVIFELQGSLFFGTASQLQGVLEKEVGERKFVILSMRRVQSLDITATHVLEQIKDRLEECDAYLVFCDIPKGLPSGLKMKRFLKATGVVGPTNKAFAFKRLDEALEWVMSQGEATQAATELPALELKELPVFSGQSEASLRDLESVLEVHALQAGEVLFSAGDKDDELLIVRRGAIRVSVPIPDKESYHLINCGPGEFVGGMGFIAGGGHVTDAVAVSDAEVYALSRKRFNALSRQHPELALVIIENVALNLSSRLRITIDEVQALRG